jgi:hypothetical protein
MPWFKVKNSVACVLFAMLVTIWVWIQPPSSFNISSDTKLVDGKLEIKKFLFPQYSKPTSLPAAKLTNSVGLFKPCATVEKNNSLTDVILNAELGWAKPPPEWIRVLCPEVVEHYNKFPCPKDFFVEHNDIPIQTTNFAARAICTLSIVKQLAVSISVTLHIYAGSHLGAILHGQPIPWDDEVRSGSAGVRGKSVTETHGRQVPWRASAMVDSRVSMVGFTQWNDQCASTQWERKRKCEARQTRQ